MLIRRYYVVAAAFLLLAACAMSPPDSIVYLPTTAKPHPPEKRKVFDRGSRSNGSIFARSSALVRHGGPEFLDLYGSHANTAHQVGDILTVLIEERASASSQDDGRGSSSGEMSLQIAPNFDLPIVPDFIEKHFRGKGGTGDASASHQGGGSVSSSNAFSGYIGVTVLDVLNNGNLLVSGEKQMRINSETDVIRLSGIVDPRDILLGNVVSSTRLADARLERVNQGVKRLYSEPGWLTRFFLSIKPF